jgi:ABC-type multidrug transport system fused ATPase/permease subunit
MIILKKILFLLTKQEKKRLIFLLLMMLCTATLDTIGVASILPFIAVLSNPQLIETNQILSMLYKLGNFQTHQEFFFILGLLVFLMLTSSLAFKALTTYFQIRFTLMREYTISRRLIEGYLHQPYEWFLNKNSSDLGKNILSEVNKTTSGIIIPILDLIAQSCVALLLVALLLFVDPFLSLVVAVVLGCSYSLVYKYLRSFLGSIGKGRVAANQNRFISTNEAFGGIKEVKFANLESVYIKKFSEAAEIFARSQSLAQVIERIPRFVLEAIAFGGMLIIILYLLSMSYSFLNIIPIIALYAFAGYRLLPAIQQIYAALAQIRFSEPSLNILYYDIVKLSVPKKAVLNEKISFKDNIALDHIYYNYPNSIKTALNNVNISIPAKTTVGLVGVTGSGKTTIIDLILGLLEPHGGSLKIDGKIIEKKNIRSWQKLVGYVPQQIFLVDDSVEANIAFGVDPSDLDQTALERAAMISNINDFILNELPLGYKTIIGERGVRISGGQRQRIGIARALYHNPQVLVFDEATSALDNLTEQAIMDSVKNLAKKITIIIVAHRLTTVRMCEKIYHLENGTVISEGSYEELLKQDVKFKRMAQ